MQTGRGSTVADAAQRCPAVPAKLDLPRHVLLELPRLLASNRLQPRTNASSSSVLTYVHESHVAFHVLFVRNRFKTTRSQCTRIITSYSRGELQPGNHVLVLQGLRRSLATCHVGMGTTTRFSPSDTSNLPTRLQLHPFQLIWNGQGRYQRCPSHDQFRIALGGACNFCVLRMRRCVALGG